jgi:hypothetical protein
MKFLCQKHVDKKGRKTKYLRIETKMKVTKKRKEFRQVWGPQGSFDWIIDSLFVDNLNIDSDIVDL